MYYKLNDVFRFKGHMGKIHDGVEEKKIFPDASILGAFLDNHDNHRFLSQNSDWTCLKNGLAYIIFAEVYIQECRREMSKKIAAYGRNE